MPLVPRRVFVGLLVGILVLTAASVSVHAVRLTTGHDHQLGLKQLFDLNGERNLASWFSSAILLTAATLLCSIGLACRARGERFTRHWLAMSAIFLVLAIDEVASIHELLTKPLRSELYLSSLFHYAWIVPGSIFALVFLFFYLKFLRELPVRTRWLFVISGAVFVGGAVGMEAIEGYYDVTYGHGGWGYVVLSTMEEVAEMLGISLFVFALMDYMALHVPEVRISIVAENRGSAAGPAAPRRAPAPAAALRPDADRYVAPSWPESLLRFRHMFAAVLGGYTLAILMFEWTYSQAAVRPIFQDIYGDTAFKGLNTTLCVAFLWGAAILFSVVAVCCSGREDRRMEQWFALSQVALFAYLACDDRFQFHERIGRQLSIDDSYVVGALGVLEVFLIWKLGRFGTRDLMQRRSVLLAGGLFGVMAFVDSALPSDLRLRLSAEDLLKAWSCAMLFLFAWDSCRSEILALRARAAIPVAAAGVPIALGQIPERAPARVRIPD